MMQLQIIDPCRGAEAGGILGVNTPPLFRVSEKVEDRDFLGGE